MGQLIMLIAVVCVWLAILGLLPGAVRRGPEFETPRPGATIGAPCTLPSGNERVIVTTELWVEAMQADALPVRTRTTVEAPADWREVVHLRTRHPSDPRHHDAVRCLFRGEWPLSLDQPPILRLQGGIAVITAETSDRLTVIYEYDEASGCFGRPLGPWWVRKAGDRYKLCIRDADVPASATSWTAKVHLVKVAVRRTSQMPEVDDGRGNLSWRFGQRSTPAVLDVDLRLLGASPAWRVRDNKWLRGLRQATRLLTASVIFVLVGWVLWRGRRLEVFNEVRVKDARQFLIRVMLVAVPLSLLPLRLMPGEVLGYDPRWAPHTALLVLGAMALLSVLVRWPPPAGWLERLPGWGRKAVWLMPTLLGLAVGVLLLREAELALRWPLQSTEKFPEQATLVLLSAGLLVMTLFALASISGVLAVAPLRDWVRGRAWRHAIAWVAVAALAVATVAEAWLAAWNAGQAWYLRGDSWARLASEQARRMLWLMLRDYPAVLLTQLAGDLLSLLALAGLFWLLCALHKRRPDVLFDGPPMAEQTLLVVLFAGFVVGRGGSFAGLSIPIAMILALALLRYGALRDRIQRIETKARQLNHGAADDHRSVLAAHQDQLLWRATRLVAVRKRLAALKEAWTSGGMEQPSYNKQRAPLEREEHDLEVGGQRLGRPGVPQLLMLPQEGGQVRPEDLVFALGPERSWWDNGVVAMRRAAPLVVPAVLYQLYVLYRDTPMLLAGSFRTFRLLASVLVEVEFWLVAAFVLGALYPYLWGRNGVAKGEALASTYILAQGLSGLLEAWVRQETISALAAVLTVRAWLLLIFLVILGVRLDRWTLQQHGYPQSDLFDLYQLHSLRRVALYLSPLLVAVLGIIQQVQAGYTQDAITEIIRTLPQAIPGDPATP